MEQKREMMLRDPNFRNVDTKNKIKTKEITSIGEKKRKKRQHRYI